MPTDARRHPCRSALRLASLTCSRGTGAKRAHHAVPSNPRTCTLHTTGATQLKIRRDGLGSFTEKVCSRFGLGTLESYCTTEGHTTSSVPREEQTPHLGPGAPVSAAPHRGTRVVPVLAGCNRFPQKGSVPRLQNIQRRNGCSGVATWQVAAIETGGIEVRAASANRTLALSLCHQHPASERRPRISLSAQALRRGLATLSQLAAGASVARSDRVQPIGPPLHHRGALGQVVGVVVRGTHTVALHVSQLQLDEV